MLKYTVKITLIIWGITLFAFLITLFVGIFWVEHDFRPSWYASLASGLILNVGFVLNEARKKNRISASETTGKVSLIKKLAVAMLRYCLCVTVIILAFGLLEGGFFNLQDPYVWVLIFCGAFVYAVFTVSYYRNGKN